MFPKLLSDTDRDRCLKELQQACADGRLNLDELGDRVAVVLAARTDIEVIPAFRGLGRPPLELPAELVGDAFAKAALEKPAPNREWILGLLGIGALIAAGWLVYTVGVAVDPGPADPDGIRRTVLVFGVTPGLIGLGAVIAAMVGTWRGREWGRVFATLSGLLMILTVCGLPFGVVLLAMLLRGARAKAGRG